MENMETDERPDEDRISEKEVNGDATADHLEAANSHSSVQDSHHSDGNSDDSASDVSLDETPKRGVKRKLSDQEIDEHKPKHEKLELSDGDHDGEGGKNNEKSADDSNDSTKNKSEEQNDSEHKISVPECKESDVDTFDSKQDMKEEKHNEEESNTEVSESLTPKSVTKDVTESTNKLKSSVMRSPTEGTRQSLRANRNSNPAAFLIKKPKLPTDMSNPAYRKPFKHGWRRELVYRANSETNINAKRNGDIYYFTPDGKKVRSMREVIENLKTKDLGTENFTFYKEPLGLNDPKLEIIRVAKVKGASSTVNSINPSKKLLKSKKVPKIIEKQSSSVLKSDKAPKFSNAFKVKLSGARLSLGKRTVSPNKSDKKTKSAKNSMQIGMLPPDWQSPKRSDKSIKLSSTQEKVKQSEQCSIRCKGVDPVVPTMQCSLCLCLYHPECVGLTSSCIEHQQSYVCKNCRPEDEVMDNMDATASTAESTLPPLTPFSALKSHAPISSVPPKLHRIIAQSEKSKESLLASKKSMKNTKLLTVPKFVKTNDSRGGNVSQPEGTKSLVGSVTTWLPPSSTIQMAHSNNDAVAHSTASEPSQSQAIIGGRKFIIIPKQNVLSILPNEQSNVIPASENAPTPSTTTDNSSTSGSQIPTTLDSLPATASLGPLLPDSEIITHVIATNNALNPQLDLPKPSSISADSSSPINIQLTTESSVNQISHQGLKENSCTTAKQTAMDDRALRAKRGSRKSSTPAPQLSVPRQDVEKDKFMQNFFCHISAGYSVLLQVFQYLKVQELLRASRVCRMWRDIAAHSTLWRVVRMKNSQVRDWQGLATSLKRHETRTLDLRKMLIPDNGEQMWPEFSKALPIVDSLTRIDLCRCPGTVVEEFGNSNKNLQIINATTLRCDILDLTSYENVSQLEELRLKSQNGSELKNDLSPFKHLTMLKHLSLLSIKDLGKKNVATIAGLSNLVSLELGECGELPENFGSEVLTKLKNLEKFRMEKGPTMSCTHNILEAISKLTKMEQLELVNFDVKAGFDKAIEPCTNIKRLLLIPTYISQSATTNHMVLSGVLQLSTTLTHFTWGVTLELLRVTELFVDQCDQSPKKKAATKKNKKITGDSIPILKPVPFLKDITDEHAQVEILPIPKLQKLLSNKMNETKVKILKIPFHATWRQTISDTVV